MKLNEYQELANRTDQTSNADDIESLLTPVLGISGRIGALSTEYLRHLRDKTGYQAFDERVGETLGDVLWYVANIAQKAGLTLEDVARGNLSKTSSRWGQGAQELKGSCNLDAPFLEGERFPMKFVVEVGTARRSDGTETLALTYEDQPFGDPLTDNAEKDDGYRFHDIFHLAFVAHLGWSPVLRGKIFFNCKRKSSPLTDEVEDGGRAAVIDEAIAALIFNEAGKRSFYEGVNTVSTELLQLIGQLTAHLEVRCRTMAEWERAILNAFHVWRQVRKNPAGKLIGNRTTQHLEYIATVELGRPAAG